VTVQPDGKHANFLPQFYVAEHPDTEEITGTSALAVELPFDLSELNSEDELNSQLRVRAEILSNFTKALIYYSQKDYTASLRTLKLATKSAETMPETFEGQEVLYLLAAKAYTRQTDYENANQMLDQALVLNPNYARAHLGRGNIYYQQGKIIPQAGKPPAYNQDLLLKAKTEYELALQSFDGSEDPYIPIKARTNLGNVFLNLGFIHNGDADLLAQATDHYLYVIGEFQRTKDPFLRSYAAIAYSGLAVMDEQGGKVEQALAAYQQAYSLTDDPDVMQEIARQIESLERK
jgi:tetratricopeptide (TPR) repeat protein